MREFLFLWLGQFPRRGLSCSLPTVLLRCWKALRLFLEHTTGETEWRRSFERAFTSSG